MQRFYCETHEVSYEGDGECPVCVFVDAALQLELCLGRDYSSGVFVGMAACAGALAGDIMQEADAARAKA